MYIDPIHVSRFNNQRNFIPRTWTPKFATLNDLQKPLGILKSIPFTVTKQSLYISPVNL